MSLSQSQRDELLSRIGDLLNEYTEQPADRDPQPDPAVPVEPVGEPDRAGDPT